MNERFDLIILDNVDAVWANNKCTWRIPDHYFTEYKKNDVMYMQLIGCQFSSLSTMTPPVMNTAGVILENVIVDNQKNLSNEQVLSIVDCSILFEDPSYYISNTNTMANEMKLRFRQKFNTITLYVDYQTEILDINTKPSRFILKISYHQEF